jgi:DNA invertase Pin-like site-specific DNA recombinase
MMLPDNKVRDEHLRRIACVYVRQSTLAQVREHQESTRRQYALHQRARQLGWPPERIEIIDEDLGHSASDASHVRAGFQKLLSKVVTGAVGAVFSVEVSRLARQDSEGHRLVEVAALTDTLLLDEQQAYDPRLSDDRLMLGLKVLLSSNEIRLMNQRLRENKLRKAQRGELRLNLPVGLVFVPPIGIQLDPDEQVQHAVRLLFERFRLSGRLSTVVRYFHDNGLLFPRRKGAWYGQLEWDTLSLERTRDVLANPLYAGAYVYGRTKRQAVVRSEQHIERPRQPLPVEEWAVVRWDAFPGYIDRAEYTANQARLAHNQANPHLPARARRRDGPALLGGLILCGRCGQPMHVGYHGTNGTRIVYLCNTRQIYYAEPACQRIPGAAVDRFVMEHVLAALAPAQIELSLAVLDELERQQTELLRQWQRRLEAARYAANLAQRRYEQVDPANRLVARTLEQQWEACLREIDRLEAEFGAFRRERPVAISIEQRRSLLNLAADLSNVWSAPTTSWTERKDLLQLLIADVALTRDETAITVQIRWLTNQVETGQLPLPTRRGLPTPTIILERIRSLCSSHTDQEIADILNQEGLTTSNGNSFTTDIVEGTRLRNGIRKRAAARP